MDTILAVLLEVLLAGAGRLAIWIFSFGRWKNASFAGNESRIYAAAGALSFVCDGQRFITHTGQLFAGLAFYVFVILVVGAAYAAAV